MDNPRRLITRLSLISVMLVAAACSDDAPGSDAALDPDGGPSSDAARVDGQASGDGQPDGASIPGDGSSEQPAPQPDRGIADDALVADSGGTDADRDLGSAPDALIPDASAPDTGALSDAGSLSPDSGGLPSPDSGSPSPDAAADAGPSSPDLGGDSLAPDSLAPDTLAADLGVPDSSPFAPTIFNVVVSPIGRHTATVTFSTSAPATATVFYDLNGLTKVVSDTTLKTSHALNLDRLISGASQSYRIVIEDAQGRQRFDQARSFTTASYSSNGLPSGWSSQDVAPSAPPSAGATVYDATALGGAYSLRGVGAEIFFKEDDFHYAYRAVSGDFTLTARVEGWYGYLDTLSKGALLFRNDLTTGSTMFTMSINYDESEYVYYRQTANTDHVLVHYSELNATPGSKLWVRLRRVGNTFTTYWSQNGATWTVHGPSAGTTVNLPTQGWIGLGVASKNPSYMTEVVYSNVSVTTP